MSVKVSVRTPWNCRAPLGVITVKYDGDCCASLILKAFISSNFSVSDGATSQSFGDEFLGGGDTGKDGFSGLSFIKPEIVERIGGKTLLADENGNYIFVKRNLGITDLAVDKKKRKKRKKNFSLPLARTGAGEERHYQSDWLAVY